MRLSRGLLAAGSGLLLAISGCTSSGSTSGQDADGDSAEGRPQAEEIAWTDCNAQIQPLIAGSPGGDRALSFECGRTAVPITYAEPEGETLPIFLVRARMAEQADRIGSLLVNPGGPGVSGADAAIDLSLTLPPEVLQRFDIVGFDPRGVGLSTPVECIPPELKDQLIAAEPRPTTEEQLDAHFALTRELAEGCAEEYPDALGTFNTVATARDMDLLREALGDEQLTYLGYAYGTTLGSTYAELFPDRVRAMVLDAAVAPDADPAADAEASAAGYEAAFDAFAAYCTQLVAGCPIGAEPRQFVENLLAAAAANPIPSAEAGETRTATPGVILTAVRAGVDDTATWPQLAQALAAAQQGDSQWLFSLADDRYGRLEDGTYSNRLDAGIAISCADTEEEYDEDDVRQAAAEWNERYPLFGAGSAVGLYTCSPWEAERTPLPERDAEGSAPILVIGTSGDPVTPLAGAVELAEALESGVLLTWQAQDHIAYPGTDCINAAVNAYLIDLAVPQEGLTCPA